MGSTCRESSQCVFDKCLTVDEWINLVNSYNDNFIACKASGPKYIEQYIEQLSKCRESGTLSLYITS